MAVRGLKWVLDTVNTQKWVLVVEKLEKNALWGSET